MRKFSVSKVVFVAAFLALVASPTALGDSPKPATRDLENPCGVCPSYHWVLTFRQSDGKIRSLIGYDPVVQPGWTNADVRNGEATLDITGNPVISDLVKPGGLDAFVVDPGTHLIQPVGQGATATSGLGGTDFPMIYVVVGLIATVGLAGCGAALRLTRRRA